MRLIDADALLAAYDAKHEGTPGRARELIENAPTVEPTLYGYSIDHLAMVAMMLMDNSITPDSMRETLTNAQKMFGLVWEETQRKIEDVIRDWGGETND